MDASPSHETQDEVTGIITKGVASKDNCGAASVGELYTKMYGFINGVGNVN